MINTVVRLEGVIGLPEVVEEEIVKHATKAGREAFDQIWNGLRRIEMLVGYVDGYSPPGEAQAEAGARERLGELAHLLKRLPYSFEQLRSALERVMDETPPNGPRNQQYKDSVIWEAVLELAKTHAVQFVTEDKAFFAGREPSRGLATNLREECEVEGRDISIHHGLEACLEALREVVPPLDHEVLAMAVETAIKDELLRIASTQESELYELIDFRVSAYLTEKPEILALSFELDYRASVVSPVGEEVETSLVTKGDSSYDVCDRSASEVRLYSVNLVGAEGEQIQGKGVAYLYPERVNMGGGRQRWPYSLRAEVDRE